MKKKIIIAIAVLLIVVTFACAGCSLFANTTNDLANKDSSSNSTTTTTYTDVSRTELEAALTNYRAIAETLSNRISDLEEVVRSAIGGTKTNIGAYASVYTDCLLNITCTEGSSSVQGSGFVITDDGYVLTNNHVVTYEVREADLDKPTGRYDWFGNPLYQVKTVNYVYSSVVANFDSTSKYYFQNTSYALEVLYTDPAYDLALCKLVETVPVGTAWEKIPFYDGTVARGDELLLLGNAYGFGLSATSGLISATGKTFTDYPKLTFIQTDAAINGGNSGGPAINIYGGLVGVVNSKFVNTNIENMGFAIELDKVKEFIAAAETAKSVKVNYSTVKAA